jgi:hypothetical protein
MESAVNDVSAASSAANAVAADLLFEDESGSLANLVNLLVKEMDGNEFYSTVGEESNKQGQVYQLPKLQYTICFTCLLVALVATRVVFCLGSNYNRSHKYALLEAQVDCLFKCSCSVKVSVGAD